MDYFVVGAGITGSVIARHLADKDKNNKVFIIEKRSHIGGNMFDYVDQHGIRVHKYGPHTFHTNSFKVFCYVNLFSEWIHYKSWCMAVINNKFTPCPFNYQTIDDFYSFKDSESLKKNIELMFPKKRKETIIDLLRSENYKIREYALFLFNQDYKLYTSKQWGIDAEKIDISILKRVPVKFSYDKYYFDDRFQILPKNGYEYFFKNLLEHKNIKIITNENFLNNIKINFDSNDMLLDGRKMKYKLIYTGPLDELLDYRFGSLPYRSLEFKWNYENIHLKQPAPIVVYPQAKDFTRIVEYKQMPNQNVQGTSYAIEYPTQYIPKSNEPYYPILTSE
ncbi:UDP-galactopyranose mutase, partial [Campylobacter jejuni]|nr:UDP-galactopyranose mutase [Campylobacter jejuni]